ncbi:MAG TPA: prolipoprotein diacylglyceryl transferase family protein [Gemmatimonadaceae bacterium]|nr:prolipoprotein diacylglyceryl transferase family protein [Gemmatimonadaceae bacterium]
MLAYVPFVQQPSIALGPVTLAAFGGIVASSVAIGFALGARRFAALGLDRELGERFAWWVVAGGFVSAHLFALLLYFPEKVVADPWSLLRLWEDISSFGGIVGGALAIALFLRLHGRHLDAATRWAYVDTAAYVFPISLMIGRFACALAHDHPGTVTRFPLAIALDEPAAQSLIAQAYASDGRAAELPPTEALAQLGFHDLGWYEFVYLAIVVVPLTLAHERRARRAGWPRGDALARFIVLYMPVRFALDFLRVRDVRYAGLTPAQWTALVALALLPLVLRHARRVATSVESTSMTER